MAQENNATRSADHCGVSIAGDRLMAGREIELGKLFPKRQQTFFYLIAAIQHVNVNSQDVAIGFIEGVKRRYGVFEVFLASAG